MDASMLFASLDSLWFFNNVLSSPMTQKQSLADENELKPTKTFESVKPINVIVEKSHKDSHLPENLCLKCLKRREFASEANKPQAVEFSVQKQSKETRKQRRRKRRSKKGLPEGFDHGNLDYNGPRVFWEREYGSQRFGAAKHDGFMDMILPSINDGIAMKQQLRTWAHAVACSVR